MNRNAISGLVLVIAVIAYWNLYEPQYVFSPEAMQDIARKSIFEADRAVQISTEGAVDADNKLRLNVTVTSVVRQLNERYPGRILPHPMWMFNNAGGAMGSMLVLHCSLTEYLLIFGSATGTEGHSGRFMADDYFTMLYGEQWASLPGSLQKEVYRPGDQHWLPRGTAKQYRLPDTAWALEYARGNILSMLPFGFADGFTSTLDFKSLASTVYISAYGVIRELLKL